MVVVAMFVLLRTGVTANFSLEVPSGPSGSLVVSNTITEHNPPDNDLMSELLSDVITGSPLFISQ